MNDFRCGKCTRLLAKIDGKSRVEIVCPKCKTMNVISEVMDMQEWYSKVIEPSNKTMITFETEKKDDFKGVLKSLIDDADAHFYEQIPKPHDNESKFMTYQDFDEAYKKALPKLIEDWEKVMNEESALAKLFDKTK